MDNDPHRGRGGRYTIDDDGNRVPVTQPEPDSFPSPNSSSPDKGRVGGVGEVETPPAIEAEKLAADKPKQPKRSK